ncbi:MAG: 1,4-dihydroxy-6-naphthoate synthase [Flavobacteriales bacterium]
MKISFGFSPCPNDTFMFDALIHQKIDTEGIEFQAVMDDVEALNQMAIQHSLELTKLSYSAFLHVHSNYNICNSGSALGMNCGPLLISTKDSSYLNEESLIAVPGKYTTANSLFNFCYPNYKNTIPMLFSEIEQAVLNKKVDAGVIIHENRFTYAEKGLKKLTDLGQYWQTKTNLPIPLGGIAVSKSLPKDTQMKIERVIKRSINFAFNNPKSSREYVKKYAQEMDNDVITKHINLYVNEYSLELGNQGRQAIDYLFKQSNISSKNIFIGL